MGHNKKTWLLASGALVLITVMTAVYLAVVHGGNPAPPSKTTSLPAPNATARSAADKAADDAASDNRQRVNANAVITMLTNYTSENGGVYPVSETALQEAINRYGKMVAGGTVVVYKQSYDAADVLRTGSIFYYPSYKCNADTDTPEPAVSARSVAVLYALSGGKYGCTGSS